MRIVDMQAGGRTALGEPVIAIYVVGVDLALKPLPHISAIQRERPSLQSELDAACAALGKAEANLATLEAEKRQVERESIVEGKLGLARRLIELRKKLHDAEQGRDDALVFADDLRRIVAEQHEDGRRDRRRRLSQITAEARQRLEQGLIKAINPKELQEMVDAHYEVLEAAWATSYA